MPVPVKWPATGKALAEAGYRDSRSTKWCSCGAIMFWFITPGGKYIPLSMTKDDRFEPHRASCKDVKNYRVANREHRDRARPEKRRAVQGKLW